MLKTKFLSKTVVSLFTVLLLFVAILPFNAMAAETPEVDYHCANCAHQHDNVENVAFSNDIVLKAAHKHNYVTSILSTWTERDIVNCVHFTKVQNKCACGSTLVTTNKVIYCWWGGCPGCK